MTIETDRQDRLVRTVAEQHPFDHSADDPKLIETHISWLLLAGPYAYKIKRPVDFGFLDYSSLERRKRFCEEELRLNRRTAPELYLDVVTISGDPERPQIDAAEQPLEYAVRMVRFAEDELLSRRLAADRLAPEVIDQLARRIADFHAGLAPSYDHGRAEQVFAPIADNFRHIRNLQADPPPELAEVERWTHERYAALEPRLEARHAAGFIRECHGDLHLNNVVLHRGQPLPFDAIEFNDELRFIDPASEIAFFSMDLDGHERPNLAVRFLNGYLTWSGDFGLLPLLRFYQVYRAMVRAKVAAIRLSQHPGDEAAQAEFRTYLNRAVRYTRSPPPFLLLTCGVSGSGKSTWGRDLAIRFGAVHLRSDIERKRLFGLTPDADSRSSVDGGIYTKEASARTYQRLAELSGQTLDAGLPVVVDATFLERGLRDDFRALAEQRGLRALVLYTQAAPSVLRARVEGRLRAGADPSEANLEVLESQLARQQPPGDDEPVVVVDTGADHDRDAVVAEIALWLGVKGEQ